MLWRYKHSTTSKAQGLYQSSHNQHSGFLSVFLYSKKDIYVSLTTKTVMFLCISKTKCYCVLFPLKCQNLFCVLLCNGPLSPMKASGLLWRWAKTGHLFLLCLFFYNSCAQSWKKMWYMLKVCTEEFLVCQFKIKGRKSQLEDHTSKMTWKHFHF